VFEAGAGGAAAIDPLSGSTSRGAAGAADFGVPAKGGAESVEAGVDSAVAGDALSGLAVCGAVDGAAGFGVSGREGAESVEDGVDAAVTTDALLGLVICGAAVRAAGFGVSAGGGAESVEEGVDGGGAMSEPSGLILTVTTGVAAWFNGAEVNAGAVDSRPEEARFGVATSAVPPAGTEPLFAVLASGRVSVAPAFKGAASRLSSIAGRESLEGSEVCSFCDPSGPFVVATESSSVRRSGTLFTNAKPAPTAAAAASAIAPTVRLQRRDLGLLGF
jgi:hypothetical protein